MASSSTQLAFAVRAVNEASKTLKDIQGDIQGISDKAEKSHGPLSGLGSSLGSVAKIAGGILTANVFQAGAAAVTGFVGGAVDAAKDLGESLNAVNVVFKDSSDKVLQWGKDNATAYGLSSREFNQLVTPIGAMLQNYGFSADEAGDKSIELTKRAADMASVFNVDVGEALEAIQAGLRGESDPLEKFGVGLNAAAIESKALAMTGKGLASALTDQEKKAASMALIMEQTAAVQGDFANTSGDLANAQRIAAAQTEEMQAKLGAKLLPVTLLVTKAKLALTTALVDKVIPAIGVASRIFNEDVVPVLEDVAAVIKSQAEPALTQLEQLFEGLKPVLEDVAQFFLDNKVAMIALIAVLGLVLVALFPIPAAIIAIIAAGTLLLAHWDEIKRFTTETIDSVITKVRELPVIGEIAEAVFGFIHNRVDFFMTAIKGVLDVVMGLITGDWDRVWQGLKALALAPLNLLKADVFTALNLVKGAAGDALAGLAGIIKKPFDDALAAISGLGSGAASAARGFVIAITGGLKDAVNNILIGTLEGVINRVIRGANKLVGSVNSLDVFGIVPDIPKIPEVSLPRLARGAVLDQPTLFLGGEGRQREFVSPEPLLRQVVREESGGPWIDYDRLAAAIVRAFSGVRVDMDGRTVGEVVTPFVSSIQGRQADLYGRAG